eukprot:g47782.t1
MARSDSFEESTSVTNKKLLLMQSQLEQLQEENFRLEGMKDDFRIRCEQMEKEMYDLQRRNDELTSLAEESQSLKDEMDVLRHSSDKVSKLEATVEAYKRKLEDLGDLRRQVKLLEERNTVYMQKTFDLEEELKKANSVHELHNKQIEESMKTEKWQFEFKHLQEKHDALLKEKERLIVERDALRETNEELRCAQVQQKFLNKADTALDQDVSVGNLAAEMVPAVLQEKIIQLQRENKMLRVQQEETYNNRLTEFQSMLDDANRNKHKLENENRSLSYGHKSINSKGLYRSKEVRLKMHLKDFKITNVTPPPSATIYGFLHPKHGVAGIGQWPTSNLLKRKLDEH